MNIFAVNNTPTILPTLADLPADQQAALAKVQLPDDYKAALAPVLLSPKMNALREFLRNECQQFTVYPPLTALFLAFWLAPLSRVKVVILGQDPYHGAGQAMGLAFSVPKIMPKPPSLENIFKELYTDLGVPISKHGDLSAWGNQGVLLLNSVLSVRAGAPASHSRKGWEVFTDAVISAINHYTSGTVFILWGKYAQNKGRYIDTQKHLVLTGTHPSPLGANQGGFFGTRPFSRTNDYLINQGKQPIDWALPQ